MVSLGNDLRLALDPVAFAERAGLTDPDEWQIQALRSNAPRILMNCCRQSGKSTISALKALHTALYRPGSLVLVLAPAERQSKELFSKVADFYRTLTDTPPPNSDRKLGMELPNGSRIEALPGSERTIRGFSGAALLLVDEAARVDDSLYHAVRPMLAVSGGRLILLSTPFGRRGVFFEAWTSGEGWERYEVPASECPRISPEFLEEERRSLPARVYRQEYLCSFEEVEDSVFAHEDIAAALDEGVIPLGL